MPTYDYKCTACEHTMEVFQSMKDAPLRKCPACGKQSLERLIGVGGAVLFKGSGFYQTDYRSDSYAKAAKSDAPTDAKPAGDTPKAGCGGSCACHAPSSSGSSKPTPPAKKAKA
jgi:putative FmdB family regulatory protein